MIARPAARLAAPAGACVSGGLVFSPRSLELSPDGAVALESRSESKLPHALALAHVAILLHVAELVPEGEQNRTATGSADRGK